MNPPRADVPLDQRALVLRLFVFFSRFEYALKAAGWARAGRGQAAEPDWNRAIEELKEAGDGERAEVLACGQLLLTAPPRKQVFVNGRLAWRDVRPDGDKVRHLVEAVKRVRNNLFHGGKHGEHNLYLSDRAVRLIMTSQDVLTRMLHVSRFREVSQRFHRYTVEER